MPTLHLGVVDLPYADKSGDTTGSVAEILEAKYHIMETYAEDVGSEAIGHALELSAVHAIENLMMGAPVASIGLTSEAENEIETAFRLWLTQRELDGVMPGVPTQAALKGVNHRLKHPYAKGNPSRPSFVDTSEYETSFKTWVD